MMDGKVIVMTGATSGIGQIAAERLAEMGARLVIVARDRARGEKMLADLVSRTPGRGHSIHYADLSRLKEVKRVARDIAAVEARIDVLVNNAGAMFARRAITEDGLERTFALNHMAYFVLTAGLVGRLVASAQARVINTASNAHRKGRLDFDDLRCEKSYRPFVAYGTSKLCNILFTRELARRVSDLGVTVNSFSPGFVATRFGDEAGGAHGAFMRVAKVFAKRPEQGAETLVWLATSPDITEVSGEYFYQCRRGTLTADAQDDSLARRLWAESEAISLRA
jgi:NAD(P)-dependent dehydrogenase (short-subunit alcohol dehydrogenase family)